MACRPGAEGSALGRVAPAPLPLGASPRVADGVGGWRRAVLEAVALGGAVRRAERSGRAASPPRVAAPASVAARRAAASRRAPRAPALALDAGRRRRIRRGGSGPCLPNRGRGGGGPCRARPPRRRPPRATAVRGAVAAATTGGAARVIRSASPPARSARHGGARPRRPVRARAAPGTSPAGVVHLDLVHRDVARAPGAPGHRGAQHRLGRQPFAAPLSPASEPPPARGSHRRSRRQDRRLQPGGGHDRQQHRHARAGGAPRSRTRAPLAARDVAAQRAAPQAAAARPSRAARGSRRTASRAPARRSISAGARLEDERLHLRRVARRGLGDLGVRGRRARRGRAPRAAHRAARAGRRGAPAARRAAGPRRPGRRAACPSSRATCSRRARRIDRQRLRAIV